MKVVVRRKRAGYSFCLKTADALCLVCMFVQSESSWGTFNSSLLYLQNVICLQNETRVARCGLFDHFYTHLVGHKCNCRLPAPNLFLQFTSTTELSLPSSHQYPNAFFMFRLFASADTYPPTLPDFK